MKNKKVYYRISTGYCCGEWCPECDSELQYTESDGHIYCVKCDYQRWED